ncbi:MAG: glycosyltransferase [Acidobacteriota bacterium]
MIATSIVIPSYNHARFLPRALDSVLDGQGDIEPEIVVVDDGSTDDSVAVLETYRAHLGARMQLITQANRGAHVALNRAIDRARGDLVFILNSDDAFASGRLPRVARAFAEQPALRVAVSHLTVVDADDATLGVKEAWHTLPPWPTPGPGPTLSDTGDPQLALLETNYAATTSNVAFRRTFWRPIDRDGTGSGDAPGLRFQPLRYAHDWDGLLTLSGGADALALIDEPLVRYRVHGANTIREGDEAARAKGAMRFEILWSVARHASRLLRDAARRGVGEVRDLRRRFWQGAPRFGQDDLLAQLLALRGPDDAVPSTYDALLDPHHPLRRRAVARLGAAP